jgi:hypothetical protein
MRGQEKGAEWQHNNLRLTSACSGARKADFSLSLVPPAPADAGR